MDNGTERKEKRTTEEEEAVRVIGHDFRSSVVEELALFSIEAVSTDHARRRDELQSCCRPAYGYAHSIHRIHTCKHRSEQ